MSLVDNPDWHQHHPGAHIEGTCQEEVDVGLLQLELAGLLQPFDQRMFQLQFPYETNAIRERVGEQQDEAVEVDPPVFELRLVEVQVHVAGDGCARWLGPPLRVLREDRCGKQAEKERL